MATSIPLTLSFPVETLEDMKITINHINELLEIIANARKALLDAGVSITVHEDKHLLRIISINLGAYSALLK